MAAAAGAGTGAGPVMHGTSGMGVVATPGVGAGAGTGAVVVTPGGVAPGDPAPAPQKRGRAPARAAQPSPESWEGRLVTALQSGAWTTRSYLLGTAGTRWWTTAATTLLGLLDVLTQDPQVTVGALLAYVELHCFATGPPARLVDGLTQCVALQRLAQNALTVDDVLGVLQLWILRCLNNKRVTMLQDVESFAEGVMAMVTTAQTLQQGQVDVYTGSTWQAVCNVAHLCFDDAVQQARNQVVLATGMHDREPEDSKSFILLGTLDVLADNMVAAAAEAAAAVPSALFAEADDLGGGNGGHGGDDFVFWRAGDALPLVSPRCGGVAAVGATAGAADANSFFLTPLRSQKGPGSLPRTPWSGLSGFGLDFGIATDAGQVVLPHAPVMLAPCTPVALPSTAAAAEAGVVASTKGAGQDGIVQTAAAAAERARDSEPCRQGHAHVFVMDSLLPACVLDALREGGVPLFA